VADSALFIGYGNPVRGRETKSIQVFNEAVQFWTGLQQSGRIESFEVGLLEPHGGDLNGFSLLRGSNEQLGQLRASEDFQRMTVRAALIVENLGIVGVAIGPRLMEQMAVYQQQLSELA
jgi:hypothetical protein